MSKKDSSSYMCSKFINLVFKAELDESVYLLYYILKHSYDDSDKEKYPKVENNCCKLLYDFLSTATSQKSNPIYSKLKDVLLYYSKHMFTNDDTIGWFNAIVIGVQYKHSCIKNYNKDNEKFITYVYKHNNFITDRNNEKAGKEVAEMDKNSTDKNTYKAKEYVKNCSSELSKSNTIESNTDSDNCIGMPVLFHGFVYNMSFRREDIVCIYNKHRKLIPDDDYFIFCKTGKINKLTSYRITEFSYNMMKKMGIPYCTN